MATLTKHAEYLTTLKNMMKTSELAQTNISGTPAGDPKKEKTPDNTETTDKNSVGADKNKPQEYGQKPSSNESEPLKGAKSAAVQALGSEVLTDIEKEAKAKEVANKQANAQEGIKGTPGGDVESHKMPDNTETTDKNAVGADKNKPQEYGQKPSSNEHEPLKGAKKAEVDEMAAKVASFQLGRQFAAALLKQAAFSQVADTELLKSAGRRDFETLIAQATDELEYVPEQTLKQAADAGASYFDDILANKQASESTNESKELKAKIAELEEKLAASSKVSTDIKSTLDKEAAAKEAAEKEAAFIAKIAAAVAPLAAKEAATLVEQKLKSESAK